MKNITIEDFIIGTLLGDASIPKLSKNEKNYRWTCGHGEKQLEYLNWKVNFLKENNLHTGVVTKCISYNLRYKNPCISYHSKSKVNDLFNHYREVFYPNDVKIFPDVKLNENILTILYMDDGHLLKVPNKTSKAVFNLQSFSNFDRERFCEKIKNFDLKATCRHSNGEVAISSYSMDNFRKLVEPLSMFQYKMGSV